MLAELEDDPYEVYARLRRDDPVSWLPELGQWLVTGWADVNEVLADPELFSANELVNADVREVLCQDHAPHRITDYVDTIARPAAVKLADALCPAGQAELGADYFEPVAALAEATLLEMGSLGADVLPVLDHVPASGWLAGWTLAALWAHPAQLVEVRDDRWLLGSAVYEALRWVSPVGVLTRRATRAITLGGKDIPAGAELAVCVASANRDETVFAGAARFDVHRPVRTHLGFGAGPHLCPAFPFATAIARTALDVLFDRMPDVRPAHGWRPAPTGWKLRLPGPVRAVWGKEPET